MAHWFDLCDERKHFQLVVPARARTCPPLLHAIFATSARHLSRNPRFKTEEGIVYHGHLISDLNQSVAVEYVLKCISGLSQLESDSDHSVQEHLIAAAVILRQYEELDVDGEIDEFTWAGNGHPQINFLTIIKSIIANIAPSLAPYQKLAEAAFWTAVRQEIYNAFTKERSFDMILPAGKVHGATQINRLVLHAAEVAKWRWGGKSSDEWSRLKSVQQLLQAEVVSRIIPIFQRPVSIADGEAFPTIWYNADAQVTGIQHFELAKMLLVAENPLIEYAV
ncbi:hypothetical protein D6D12_04663 [Aureobasidium pullulans]|uniref:Uncharacterized protein n=1 Tax=Aureobasidium pullulans TaxID=5580 RepID=A0AB74JUN7_AURPU|nr:hypothetical protein D6D12_04663 [Aureobasidium pullulans]